MPRKTRDFTGLRIGIRTVIGPDPDAPTYKKAPKKWLCRCDCGYVSSVFGGLLSGKRPSISCGCLRDNDLRKRNTKHGIYGTKLYWSIYGSNKRAVKLRAIPKWADEKKIKEIYANRPIGYDVDHIVPLQSPFVCGLHWEGNLQYLPKKENQSKKNRYWPDMAA